MPDNLMESRMARLEGAYEQVSDRLMNIDPRFDGLDRKIDLRFDALDKKIATLETRLGDRISSLDGKIDTVDTRLGGRITTLEAKVDKHFMWIVGLFVTTWLTTIASTYLHH